MATMPKPVAPSKLASSAKSPSERAQLEAEWARYRDRKAHYQKMASASETANRAATQRQQQAEKGTAEIEAIQRRVKRQEEGKSTWDSMADPE